MSTKQTDIKEVRFPEPTADSVIVSGECRLFEREIFRSQRAPGLPSAPGAPHGPLASAAACEPADGKPCAVRCADGDRWVTITSLASKYFRRTKASEFWPCARRVWPGGVHDQDADCKMSVLAWH